MKDIFGNEIKENPVEINIYCDEIQSKRCPYTNEEWFYIGIIVEDIANPLLEDIIDERFCHNKDANSPYYKKNNRIVHWCKIKDAETMCICKRWFEYILEPTKSVKKFYAYILGINNSKLIKEKFDPDDQFNSKYNRFFRSSILYAIKTFFPSKSIIVRNIFHEEGPQCFHKYFPWHCIEKISQIEKNIIFKCDKIIFLPKDHKKDKRSNIIQLCDAFMGAVTSLIHGIEQSKTSLYREKLMEIIFPLVKRMVENPQNQNSRYRYANRIIVRFFPREKATLDDITRLQNQFYTKRNFYYKEQKNGQRLPF